MTMAGLGFPFCLQWEKWNYSCYKSLITNNNIWHTHRFNANRIAIATRFGIATWFGTLTARTRCVLQDEKLLKIIYGLGRRHVFNVSMKYFVTHLIILEKTSCRKSEKACRSLALKVYEAGVFLDCPRNKWRVRVPHRRLPISDSLGSSLISLWKKRAGFSGQRANTDSMSWKPNWTMILRGHSPMTTWLHNAFNSLFMLKF